MSVTEQHSFPEAAYFLKKTQVTYYFIYLLKSNAIRIQFF